MVSWAIWLASSAAISAAGSAATCVAVRLPIVVVLRPAAWSVSNRVTSSTFQMVGRQRVDLACGQALYLRGAQRRHLRGGQVVEHRRASVPIWAAVSALACVVDKFCNSVVDSAPISAALSALTCASVSSLICTSVNAWICAAIRPPMVVEESAWTCVTTRYCRIGRCQRVDLIRRQDGHLGGGQGRNACGLQPTEGCGRQASDLCGADERNDDIELTHSDLAVAAPLRVECTNVEMDQASH